MTQVHLVTCTVAEIPQLALTAKKLTLHTYIFSDVFILDVPGLIDVVEE